MTDNHLPLSDEMISAYLDGELSDRERQQVEEIMRQDAAWRDQYLQLKSVRDSLSELPRYELDADFSARVLQRIRSASADPPTAASTVSRSTPLGDRKDSRGFRRGIVWAALAVTVALVLVALPRPQRDLGNQVAQAPPVAPAEQRAEKISELAQDAVADRVAPEPAAADFGTLQRQESLAGSAGESDTPSYGRRAQPTAVAEPLDESAAVTTILRIDVTPEQLVQIESRLKEDRLTVLRRVAGEPSPRAAGAGREVETPATTRPGPVPTNSSDGLSFPFESAGQLVGLVIDGDEDQVRRVLPSELAAVGKSPANFADRYYFQNSEVPSIEVEAEVELEAVAPAEAGPASDNDSTEAGRLGRSFWAKTKGENTEREQNRSSTADSSGESPRVLLLLRIIRPTPSPADGDGARPEN